MKRAGAISWWLAAGLLAALLAALWLAPGAPATWRNWAQPASQAPSVDDVQQAVLSFRPEAGATYPDIVARPLFIPSRRPVADDETTSEPAEQPKQPIDEARLHGILAGAGVQGVLLEFDGESQMVRMGDEVGGWRLTAIKGRTVRFERQGQQRELELPFMGAAAGKPAPPARASAPPSPPPPRRTTSGSQPLSPAVRGLPGMAPPAPAAQPAARPANSPGVPSAAFGGSAG